MTTHSPLRRCRVCRAQAPQDSLQRWTVVEGKLTADEAAKRAGRGYYSCSSRCAEILPRTLKKH